MATKQKQAAAAAGPQPGNAAPTNAAMQVEYKLGKPYNVRPGTQQDNARSWQVLAGVLASNKGVATRAQLVEAVQQYNHAPFVTYAIRRGWLAPA